MFDLTFDQNFVCLTLGDSQKTGRLARLFSKPKRKELDRLDPSDRELILAVAELKSLAEVSPDEVDIGSDRIRFSHRLAATLTSESAQTLGLPPLVDLTLRTDAEVLCRRSPGRPWLECKRRSGFRPRRGQSLGQPAPPCPRLKRTDRPDIRLSALTALFDSGRNRPEAVRDRSHPLPAAATRS